MSLYRANINIITQILKKLNLFEVIVNVAISDIEEIETLHI